MLPSLPFKRIPEGLISTRADSSTDNRGMTHAIVGNLPDSRVSDFLGDVHLGLKAFPVPFFQKTFHVVALLLCWARTRRGNMKHKMCARVRRNKNVSSSSSTLCNASSHWICFVFIVFPTLFNDLLETWLSIDWIFMHSTAFASPTQSKAGRGKKCYRKILSSQNSWRIKFYS